MTENSERMKEYLQKLEEAKKNKPLSKTVEGKTFTCVNTGSMIEVRLNNEFIGGCTKPSDVDEIVKNYLEREKQKEQEKAEEQTQSTQDLKALGWS